MASAGFSLVVIIQWDPPVLLEGHLEAAPLSVDQGLVRLVYHESTLGKTEFGQPGDARNGRDLTWGRNFQWILRRCGANQVFRCNQAANRTVRSPCIVQVMALQVLTSVCCDC